MIRTLSSPAAPGAVQAVIFDCDGTLVDSEEPGLDVLHQLACAEGVAMTREQADRQFRGVRMAECIAWIASHLSARPPSFEAAFTLRVREATAARFRSGLHAMPGAHALLGRLAMPFCVATNGPRDKVELTLELTGLRPLFGDRIFSAYEVGHFKPGPGLFLHAADALGVPPARCAVVEDSVPGLQAGLAAGMCVFALGDQTGLPAGLADRVTFIAGLEDLDRHLVDRIAPA